MQTEDNSQQLLGPSTLYLLEGEAFFSFVLCFVFLRQRIYDWTHWMKTIHSVVANINQMPPIPVTSV